MPNVGTNINTTANTICCNEPAKARCLCNLKKEQGEMSRNEEFTTLIDELEAKNRLQVMFPEDEETYREQRWQIKMRLFELWNNEVYQNTKG